MNAKAIHRAVSKEGLTKSECYYADRNTGRTVVVSTQTTKAKTRSTRTLPYQTEYKVMNILMTMLETQ